MYITFSPKIITLIYIQINMVDIVICLINVDFCLEENHTYQIIYPALRAQFSLYQQVYYGLSKSRVL
jgi:hypothetical protein